MIFEYLYRPPLSIEHAAGPGLDDLKESTHVEVQGKPGMKVVQGSIAAIETAMFEGEHVASVLSIFVDDRQPGGEDLKRFILSEGEVTVRFMGKDEPVR